MFVCIPMAGTGQRFIDAGFADPKPLIKVNGKRLIEYVLDMFPGVPPENFLFICNSVHTSETKMVDVLNELKPGCKIVTMDQHKNGPVFTVQAGIHHIPDEEDVMVAYCDGASMFNLESFKKHVEERDLAGCMLTHTGFHPHTISATKMAFIREVDGLIQAVQEKASFTPNPQDEHASSGQYWFRSGRLLKEYFTQALADDINYNGECYVTLVYNLLVSYGLRVGYYDTSKVLILGTPHEVRNFEAWAELARNTNIRSAMDVTNLYRYWFQFFNG